MSVSENENFPVCTKKSEVYHVLFACDTHEDIWCNRFSGLSIQRDGLDQVDIFQWLQRFVGNGELDGIFTIAWGLWYRSNKKVFSNEVINPMEATDFAHSLLTNYKYNSVVLIKWSLSNQIWTTPTLGTLKLNVDGVVFA